jgi:hypothetical protein
MTDVSLGVGNQKFQMVPWNEAFDSPVNDDNNLPWWTGYVSTGLSYTGGDFTYGQTGIFNDY